MQENTSLISDRSEETLAGVPHYTTFPVVETEAILYAAVPALAWDKAFVHVTTISSAANTMTVFIASSLLSYAGHEPRRYRAFRKMTDAIRRRSR